MGKAMAFISATSRRSPLVLPTSGAGCRAEEIWDIADIPAQNGRFLPGIKHMDAERRLPSCLVPIDFSIVGATVEAERQRWR
jgi:hypothetical protein